MPQSRMIAETAEKRAQHEEIAAEIDVEMDDIRAEGRAIRDRLARFGRMLRQAREEAGLSLAGMTARSGIDAAALSRLENGKQNPTVDTLQRYAAALGKSITIGLVDDPAGRPRSGAKT
jgi:ribosome-binding protein aMBF1 (putative translation factor)